MQIRGAMANTIYLDSSLPDDARRQALYDGQLFVHLRSDAVTRFAAFTREHLRWDLAAAAVESLYHEVIGGAR